MKNKKAAPKKPAPARKAAKPAAKPLPAGVQKLAGRPFNTLVILAPGDELLAAEAEMRLRTVCRYLATPKLGLSANLAPTQTPHLPATIRVAELTPNADTTAFALYRSFRALGRGAPTLFLCAGSGNAMPVALQTDWGNTVLTTADGTLGLLATLLNDRRIPYTITPLDQDPLLEMEQTRMENPEYTPSMDFILRDILAPAAGLLLAGVRLQALAHGGATRVATPSPTTFQSGLQTASNHLGRPMPFTAIRQPDGSYLTNLTLDPLGFDQWQDDHATFTLKSSGQHGWWTRKKTVVAGNADNPHGGHLQLSPHWAPVWDERFLSLRLEDATSPMLAGTLTRTR